MAISTPTLMVMTRRSPTKLRNRLSTTKDKKNPAEWPGFLFRTFRLEHCSDRRSGCEAALFGPSLNALRRRSIHHDLDPAAHLDLRMLVETVEHAETLRGMIDARHAMR